MIPIAISQRTLAIDGGDPVRATPSPAWPRYEADEIEAVVETLRSGKVNYWTGTQVRTFERSFAQLHDSHFALAVANGTLALEAVLRAHGVGPGDEVIVTPRSFIASASCVDIVGARPIFADVDLDTEAITPATVRPLVNKDTKAIIVVHLNGCPADMPGFMKLAQQCNLLVFEDCAQAHGARISGKIVGSFGHASAFSFCQDKIISTGGEGGMVLFKDEAAWRRAWSYRDTGKDFDRAHSPSVVPGFRWLHTGFGSNWRMTEMQAAIGLRQITKLPKWTAARTANAQKIARCLDQFQSIHVPRLPSDHVHAYYRLSFRLRETDLKEGWDRDRVVSALIAEGIPCLTGACPEIYREQAYQGRMKYLERQPNAACLSAVSLAFPILPYIDDSFVDDCCKAIEKVFTAASI